MWPTQNVLRGTYSIPLLSLELLDHNLQLADAGRSKLCWKGRAVGSHPVHLVIWVAVTSGATCYFYLHMSQMPGPADIVETATPWPRVFPFKQRRACLLHMYPELDGTTATGRMRCQLWHLTSLRAGGLSRCFQAMSQSSFRPSASSSSMYCWLYSAARLLRPRHRAASGRLNSRPSNSSTATAMDTVSWSSGWPDALLGTGAMLDTGIGCYRWVGVYVRGCRRVLMRLICCALQHRGTVISSAACQSNYPSSTGRCPKGADRRQFAGSSAGGRVPDTSRSCQRSSRSDGISSSGSWLSVAPTPMRLDAELM